MTAHYAVFGNPISHSKSPVIHSAFALQTGQDMDYRAILAPLDDFAGSVATFRDQGGAGANVTVPFKRQAYKLATRHTDRARAAEAVNTLKFENDGGILGDNTDGVGLVRDITGNQEFPIKGKRLLLLGAGGAASGVVLPLIQCTPKEIVIANRTREKAILLADDFKQHGKISGCGFDEINGSFDVVINATSASLQGQLPPLPDTLFNSGALAYDIMYGKEDTPFMSWSRRHGAAVVADGLGMLVEQAAESFFLWRGVRPATRPVIEQLRAAR
jgi:shikimate dehydrogenase